MLVPGLSPDSEISLPPTSYRWCCLPGWLQFLPAGNWFLFVNFYASKSLCLRPATGSIHSAFVHTHVFQPSSSNPLFTDHWTSLVLLSIQCQVHVGGPLESSGQSMGSCRTILGFPLDTCDQKAELKLRFLKFMQIFLKWKVNNLFGAL